MNPVSVGLKRIPMTSFFEETKNGWDLDHLCDHDAYESSRNAAAREDPPDTAADYVLVETERRATLTASICKGFDPFPQVVFRFVSKMGHRFALCLPFSDRSRSPRHNWAREMQMDPEDCLPHRPPQLFINLIY